MFTICWSGLDETALLLLLSLLTTSLENIHISQFYSSITVAWKLLLSQHKYPVIDVCLWFHLASWINQIESGWFEMPVNTETSSILFAQYEKPSKHPHILSWFFAALGWYRCHSLSLLVLLVLGFAHFAFWYTLFF